MIPAGLVGFFFEDQMELLFEGQILLVGFMLLITGVLLLLADKAKTIDKGVSYKNAFYNRNITSNCYFCRGISRSGATISTSVLLGIDRTKAAKFSFLMVVPLILGKMAKDLTSGMITMDTNIFLFRLGLLLHF